MLWIPSISRVLQLASLLIHGSMAKLKEEEVPVEPTMAPTLVLTWNETKLEAHVIALCLPPCQNNGTCRIDMETMQPVCLCPLDYTGNRCENEVTLSLKECNESTCLNGGVCTGNPQKPSCSCPPDVRGIVCERRIHPYSVNFMMMNGTAPLPWSDSLLDVKSAEFAMYSDSVTTTLEKAIKLGGDSLLVQTFVSCAEVSFTPGSVWASLIVKFEFNDTLAAMYSSDLIFQHIQTGGHQLLHLMSSGDMWIPTDFGLVNSSNFYISVVDPCLSNNHDCSKNAMCKTVYNGAYTCQCSPFTIDTSPDRRFPGRRCIYDGLIIFTFVVIGIILSCSIFILCGCRRTIWYRRQNTTQLDNVTLVKMPSNYDI